MNNPAGGQEQLSSI